MKFSLLFVLLGFNTAPMFNMGIYDSERAFKSWSQYKGALNELNRLTIKYQDTLQTLVDEINVILNKQHFLLAKEERGALEAELFKKQHSIEIYEAAVREKLTQFETDKLVALETLFLKKIKRFAQLNQIMLFDNKALIICSDCMDYTTEIVSFLEIE
ncbi:MAG: hypothetical protein MRY83_05785 [Flavobacteriales bacterium]|nr:hypothetical protein [Flavobacteriales bacterium]